MPVFSGRSRLLRQRAMGARDEGSGHEDLDGGVDGRDDGGGCRGGSVEEALRPGAPHCHHPCDQQRGPVAHGPRQCPGSRNRSLSRRRPSHRLVVGTVGAWGPGRGGGPSIDVRLVILPRGMAERKCRAKSLGDSVGPRGQRSGARRGTGGVCLLRPHRAGRPVAVTPIVRGLGHVMAHEVGHVLMGVNSHAERA